jgi:GTPase SAR1 family protein
VAAGDTTYLLTRLERCLTGDGSTFSLEIRRIDSLRERLKTGRFHLAVLGQFKRGKSTLLNALLGEPLLPTAVVPLTAIPTFIQFGEAHRIRVAREEGRQIDEFTGNTTEERAAFLRRFVTEEENPQNTLEVSDVEVFLPSPLLAKGVVLIDTPGIGSTYRHNTEAALNFLPQCDAALFLVSADPPMTQAELEFLREVRDRVPRLFFVLNKIDYLNAEDRPAAMTFLEKTLQSEFGSDEIGTIFAVSARLGLQARMSADSSLWRESGLGELEMHLIDFLASEKAVALETAVRQRARDLAESALMNFRLRMRSIELPQADLEQRIAAFDVELGGANRERIVVQDLLAGDKRRTVEYLEEQAELLRQEGRATLEKELRETLGIFKNGSVDEKAAEKVLAATIPVFFEKKFGTLAQQIDKRVASVLEPHQRQVDELVEKVRRTAAEIFEIPYRRLDSSRAFEFQNQPYWITHKWDSSFSPVPEGQLDVLLPKSLRRSRAMKRLSEKIDALVVHNVENLRWATLRNLDRAFIRFGTNIDEWLEETISATKGAIEAAYQKREQQAGQLEEEKARLKTIITDIEELKTALSEDRSG